LSFSWQSLKSADVSVRICLASVLVLISYFLAELVVIIAFGLQIECEPEYLMGEFDQNPDIDEKPPIPLRDALEKMKPFLMAYEGIQSQEEWEVTFYVLC